MIDLYININNNSDICPKPQNPADNIGYLSGFYNHRKEYYINNIYISLYSYNEKSINYYINGDDFLIILGNINRRIEGDNKTGNINHEELLILIKSDRDIYKLIKGNYTIFLINTREKSLKILNGLLSTHSVYYNTTVNNFIVSTNLMLLLKNKYCEINNQSLVEFSIFDYILGNKTFFKDIFKLEYGENINYKNIIQKRTVLYDYSNLIQSELLRTDESIELFSKLLKDNIHKFIK